MTQEGKSSDSKKNTIDHKGILSKIAQNYKTLEKRITEELKFSVKHGLTTGTFREGVWKQLFEQIIPRKFSIEQSVFIVDSNMKVSREVDLAIFDEQYTPYIFRYGNMKYIPIEAVAVVIQCKSSNVTRKEDVEKLKDWTDSIDELKTSLKSVTRIYSSIVCGEFEWTQHSVESNEQTVSEGVKEEVNKESSSGNEDDEKSIEDNSSCESKKKENSCRKHSMTQSSTRPIHILCHTNDETKEDVNELFDFVIHPAKGRNRLNICYGGKLLSKGIEPINLYQWHKALNHARDDEDFWKGFGGEAVYIANKQVKNFTLENYEVFDKKDGQKLSILSLIFQLNQLLMLINNPIQFPHLAYVKMFNDVLDGK